MRRLSLQAAGGVAEQQEGEAKPSEEAGSADSEQVTTETEGEEGSTQISKSRSPQFLLDITTHDIFIPS